VLLCRRRPKINQTNYSDIYDCLVYYCITCLFSNYDNNKAVIDIRLRPHCAIPPPRLRPISCIACAQYFSEYYSHLPGILNDPVCYTTLLVIKWSRLQRMRQRPLQRRLTILMNGPDNPENCPSPMGDLHPHLIHGSMDPPESSFKTACWSVQQFSHSARYRVPLLYNGPLRFPQKNCRFPLGE